MVVSVCQHSEFKKFGKNATGKQRLRCKVCGHCWLEDAPKPLGDMRITMRDATIVLGMLLEGMSIRAASRLTGLHQDTISDLILVVGENCEALMESIQGVEASNVECDEIWSFVGLKEKRRVDRGYSADLGDAWSWIAIDADSKLVLAHRVGARDYDTCRSMVERLRDATVGRFQLSSDGFTSYRLAVPFILRDRVDFGQIVKNYASTQVTTRYSPASIIGTTRTARFGNPDVEKIGTSHIERLNLSLRMHLRRFTRLTNGHSKSLQHHKAMLSIFFAWYNWCRVNTGLQGKQTPAMAAGIADKAWTIKTLLEKAAEADFVK
jgi:IS1 family transposase/transposase-like protein